MQSFYFVCLFDLLLRWVSGKMIFTTRRAVIVAIWIAGLVVSIFLLMSGKHYDFTDLGIVNQLITPALAIGTGLIQETDEYQLVRLLSGFAGFISMIIITAIESNKHGIR